MLMGSSKTRTTAVVSLTAGPTPSFFWTGAARWQAMGTKPRTNVPTKAIRMQARVIIVIVSLEVFRAGVATEYVLADRRARLLCTAELTRHKEDCGINDQEGGRRQKSKICNLDRRD